MRIALAALRANKARGVLTTLGIIIGIPVSGWIYDTTGSYELMLIACLVGLSLATLLATLIRPERHHPEFVTE